MTEKEVNKKYNFVKVNLVESSNIKEAGYDEKEQVAKIMFKSFNRGTEASYLYFGISKDVIDRGEHAESSGVYFAERIKGAFKYEKINDEVN